MAHIKSQIKEREERGVTRKELRYMYRRLENEISFMRKELEQSSGNPHACSYYANCLLQLYTKLDVLEEVINLTYPKKSTRYIATKLHYEFPQEEEGGGESKMEITCEVLQKIEDKLWENLEELNKDEKKLIEHRNSSFYTRCHFSDSYKYISCINLLQWLKEVVDDDKNYIKHYGLEEFETEEGGLKK